MKIISELPEPYKGLAKKHRSILSGYIDNSSDVLNEAFHWRKSPEGADFWHQVYKAKDESELPEIPEEK